MINASNLCDEIVNVLQTADEKLEADVYTTLQAFYGPTFEEVTTDTIRDTAELVKNNGGPLYPY